MCCRDSGTPHSPGCVDQDEMNRRSPSHMPSLQAVYACTPCSLVSRGGLVAWVRTLYGDEKTGFQINHIYASIVYRTEDVQFYIYI